MTVDIYKKSTPREGSQYLEAAKKRYSAALHFGSAIGIIGSLRFNKDISLERIDNSFPPPVLSVYTDPNWYAQTSADALNQALALKTAAENRLYDINTPIRIARKMVEDLHKVQTATEQIIGERPRNLQEEIRAYMHPMFPTSYVAEIPPGMRITQRTQSGIPESVESDITFPVSLRSLEIEEEIYMTYIKVDEVAVDHADICQVDSSVVPYVMNTSTLDSALTAVLHSPEQKQLLKDHPRWWELLDFSEVVANGILK